MTVDTHEVVLSFNQPGDARNPLLSILQQFRNRSLTSGPRAVTLLRSQRVLIVDSLQPRAQYIAHLLSSADYRPFVAPTPLDAYTLFLQGTFHPFAIILSEDSVASQFFLIRLSQQFLLRYDWKIPFVRLRILASEQLDQRTTGPLANEQAAPRPTVLLKPPVTPMPRSPSEPLPSQSLHSPDQAEAVPRPSGTLPPSSQRASGEHLVRMRASSLSPGPLSMPGQGTVPPPATSVPRAAPVSQAFNRPLAPSPQVSLGSGKKQAEKISLTGLSIGRYQLKSVIGGNPIGDVYLTYDRLREQDIALKTIQTNMIPPHLMENLEDDYNLFQQEMDLLQQVEHTSILHVMNIGKSYISGFPFIYKTMPYYKEGSLATWLNQFSGSGKVFAPQAAMRVILQVAEAIQFLHNRGLLYQNFKMTNILVTRETTNMTDLKVVITDLPFVRDMINLPKTVESYRYFAPEQWEGQAFTASDQYGLAVLAYELLAGRAPFQGNSDAIMRRMHLTMSPPAPSSFNPNIYPVIDKVLLRALSKHPGERFESIAAFTAALVRSAR